jgi:hypothetical protein
MKVKVADAVLGLTWYLISYSFWMSTWCLTVKKKVMILVTNGDLTDEEKYIQEVVKKEHFFSCI